MALAVTRLLLLVLVVAHGSFAAHQSQLTFTFKKWEPPPQEFKGQAPFGLRHYPRDYCPRYVSSSEWVNCNTNIEVVVRAALGDKEAYFDSLYTWGIRESLKGTLNDDKEDYQTFCNGFKSKSEKLNIKDRKKYPYTILETAKREVSGVQSEDLDFVQREVERLTSQHFADLESYTSTFQSDCLDLNNTAMPYSRGDVIYSTIFPWSPQVKSDDAILLAPDGMTEMKNGLDVNYLTYTQFKTWSFAPDQLGKYMNPGFIYPKDIWGYEKRAPDGTITFGVYRTVLHGNSMLLVSPGSSNIIWIKEAAPTDAVDVIVTTGKATSVDKFSFTVDKHIQISGVVHLCTLLPEIEGVLSALKKVYAASGKIPTDHMLSDILKAQFLDPSMSEEQICFTDMAMKTQSAYPIDMDRLRTLAAIRASNMKEGGSESVHSGSESEDSASGESTEMMAEELKSRIQDLQGQLEVLHKPRSHHHHHQKSNDTDVNSREETMGTELGDSSYFLTLIMLIPGLMLCVFLVFFFMKSRQEVQAETMFFEKYNGAVQPPTKQTLSSFYNSLKNSLFQRTVPQRTF